MDGRVIRSMEDLLDLAQSLVRDIPVSLDPVMDKGLRFSYRSRPADYPEYSPLTPVLYITEELIGKTYSEVSDLINAGLKSFKVVVPPTGLLGN